jgi:uncharacterized protein YbjT (DUF2867 family)
VTRRTALLAGATGLVGGHVLRLLLADDVYQKVTVLARRGLPLTNPKLQQRLVDFDHLADLDAPKVDDVFCCLGTTMKKAGSQEAFRKVDLGYVQALARVTVRHGAKQFLLVSAIGASPGSRIFYNRVKGEAEEVVKGAGFTTTHIFQPSLLLGSRSESRPLERLGIVVAGALGFAFAGPLRRYRPIPAATVAAAMVRAAKRARPGVHVYTYDHMLKTE